MGEFITKPYTFVLDQKIEEEEKSEVQFIITYRIMESVLINNNL